MNSNKLVISVFVCVFLLMGCLYYWVVNFSPRVVPTEDIILRKVDSLTTKIDSIRKVNDSIRLIIDTTDVEIRHTYEKYIEIREHIAYQSVDSDCVFFAEYLSQDSKRFIDTINFEPIKAY